jgi:hypothetical protein
MKIVKLTAENIKRLKAVEISPNGNMVEITGKNGQGKTSILDSIPWALGGKDGIQERPIRDGEEKAVIRLDLGEVVVTRSFKKDESGNSYVTEVKVETADGVKVSSPQALLDSFVGSLSFDPLSFSRMDDRQRFETLKKFVPDVDFDAWTQQNKEDFERRTALNRKAKEAHALAEGLKVSANAPDAPIDEKAFTEKLVEASNHNLKVQEGQNKIVRLRDDAKAARILADTLKIEAERKLKDAESLEKEAVEKEKEADSFKTDQLVDLASLKQEADSVHEKNVAYEMKQKKQKALAEAAEFEGKAEAFTKAMVDRDLKSQLAIANAKMPIPEITLTNDSVFLNGVPFSQASDAEQLRASIAIAMASNPKLKVIRVRDGSLLDEDSMTILAKMAEEADCQVWIERVDGSGKVGFVIENGMVKQ